MRSQRAPLALAMALCLLALSASSAWALGPPQIISTSFSHLGTDSVRLEAKIDPEGRATTYRFEYGPAACSSSPCTSTPGESIPAGAALQVKADVTGLAPSSTYHFRVVAKNNLSPSPVEGPDATFTTYMLEAALGLCPNEDPFRSGPSAHLADCRAYEQASPVDKNGADINGAANAVQASTDGDAVTFFAATGLPGAVGGQDFESSLARREGGNWSTRGVLPPASAGPLALNGGWTPDLSQFFSNAAESFDGPWTFRQRTSANDSFASIFEGASEEGFLAGASADGSKVYFQNPGQLDPKTSPKTENLYIWDRSTGTVSLAGVLPDSACATPPCIPPGGSFAGPYSWFEGALGIGNRDYYIQNEHTISTDGNKAYFTAGDGQIYLRKNAAGPGASTVHVSASHRTTPDLNGTQPAALMAATPDGSTAFFASSEKLTDDATTGPEPSSPAIASANVGDGSAKNFNFLPTHAKGVAVDSEYIYWANPSADAIGRAKLNGSGVEEVKEDFITGADNPQYVAVDAAHIYWTNAGDGEDGQGSIGRAEIGGNPLSVEEEFIPGEIEASPGVFEPLVSNPRGIAVNSEHVYWANAGEGNATRTIGRAEIGGGKAEGAFIQVGVAPLNEIPQGVAVDGAGIYWASRNSSNGFVTRRDLDGSPASEKFTLVGSDPQGIALDGGHVYWAGKDASVIGRANLDLSGANEEFVKEAGHPEGLAVDAGRLYWAANQEQRPNPGNDLYRFDAASGALSDVTVDKGNPNGAEVKGILGISEDGSYVYYVANGVPDGVSNSPNGRGESATLGTCQGKGDSNNLNFSGECNLYLRHGAQTMFIARLDAGGIFSDAANWEPALARQSARENTARVSADGQTLLFRSKRQLGPYPNGAVPELYRYQAGEAAAGCISCNPTGTAAVAAPSLQSIEPFLPVVKPPGRPAILTRNLSADGKRVFFESSDKLVAADTNGEEGCPLAGQANVPSCQDVYEWEANGSGSCESSAQNGGCLYLLSSGTSPEPSFFADASASGKDAFIFTRDALVPQDQDQIQDVYDARVDGGLVAQHVVAPGICEGESCKPGLASPPGFQSPQTPGFSGPGNVKAKPGCPKGKRAVHRHGKRSCVAKKHKKHQKKRSARNRGGKK